MPIFTKDQIFKEEFVIAATPFYGYLILIGNTKRGLLTKQAFDYNKDFMLYGTQCTHFPYRLVQQDSLLPSTNDDVNFVNDYFTSHPDDLTVFEASTSVYDQYRSELLSAGFTEAPEKYGRFYRHNTDKTAFIVNLLDEGYGLTAVYGFTLNSFMGDSDWFLKNGEDSECCKLRESVFLITGEDNTNAKESIEAFFRTYCNLNKEALLAVCKEKQKAFLSRFAARLKPLGFKKKGATWTKLLLSGYQITFHAQKSAYSDQYYFRFYVDPPTGSGIKLPPPECYGGQVSINGNGIFNWQLLSDAQVELIINRTINDHLLPLCKKYS